MYAEVAIPLNVHQTFTYRLPESFAAKATAGCRVLVPFGKQHLTAYIVDLHETLEETGQQEDGFEIKDIEELFDTESLVTAELLDLTKWIADYYYAPWGETIKTSLPAGINVDTETILAITAAGREALIEAKAKRPQLTTRMEALEVLAEHEQLSASELGKAKKFDKNKITAIVRELQKSGFATITRQLQSAAVKPKRQQAVRLLQQSPSEGGKPPNEQQEKVIKLLFDMGDAISLAQLTELAGVSASVIRTLEKRGFVEVFTRDVRRDPLAHLPPVQKPGSQRCFCSSVASRSR